MFELCILIKDLSPNCCLFKLEEALLDLLFLLTASASSSTFDLFDWRRTAVRLEQCVFEWVRLIATECKTLCLVSLGHHSSAYLSWPITWSLLLAIFNLSKRSSASSLSSPSMNASRRGIERRNTVLVRLVRRVYWQLHVHRVKAGGIRSWHGNKKSKENFFVRT